MIRSWNLFPAVLFFGICLALSGPLRTWEPQAPRIASDEESLRWDPLLFKAITFGQFPSAIDALWLRMLQDESTEWVSAGHHARAYWDLMVSTDLDPAFFEAYLDGGALLTVVRNDNAGARDLLERGERFRETELPKYSASFQETFWKGSWQIPILLSYVYIFELDDFPKGANAFREAASVPGSPPYLQDLVQRLDRPGGEYQVALKLVDFLIQGTKDERLRAPLEAKRRNLLISEFLDQAQRAFSGSRARSWTAFVAGNPQFSHDPEGGTLSLQNGKVVTSTPHSPVFGLR